MRAFSSRLLWTVAAVVCLACLAAPSQASPLEQVGKHVAKFFKGLFHHAPEEVPKAKLGHAPHEAPNSIIREPTIHPYQGQSIATTPQPDSLSGLEGYALQLGVKAARSIKEKLKTTCGDLQKLKPGDEFIISGSSDLAIYLEPSVDSPQLSVARPFYEAATLKEAMRPAPRPDVMSVVSVIERKLGECWLEIKKSGEQSDKAAYILPSTTIYVLGPAASLPAEVYPGATMTFPWPIDNQDGRAPSGGLGGR